ncbi:DUF945 domain-containing protein [Planctomycetales bacterium ZRK34]|nr:DUF945 domain-containing protein [Planctomycetales bacterium ZRK34]
MISHRVSSSEVTTAIALAGPLILAFNLGDCSHDSTNEDAGIKFEPLAESSGMIRCNAAFAAQNHRSEQGVRLDNPATAEEAVVAAGLDWDVQLQPIYTGPERATRVKDRYVVCRTDRLDHEDSGQLGVVGRNFTALQNRDAFGFLDPVVGNGAAIYHTAGSLRGGRRVWLLAKLPGHIRVVGDDVAEKFILLSNGHDGTAAVRIGLTPIRVVCMNTLNLALRGMGGLSIRHNPDVAQRVQSAHKLLGLVNSTLDAAEVTMQRMAGIQMTGNRLTDYFQELAPLPANDEAERNRVLDRRRRWSELFESGDGNRMPGVRGTLWAAYNAVTQWTDRESYTRRNKEPLNTIWFGEGELLKRRAFLLGERTITRCN